MAQQRTSSGAATAKLPIYKDLALLQLAALVFVIDQFTKYLVREFLALGESFPDEGFIRITRTFNTGSAFGLFRDQNDGLILVSVIGIAVLLFIYQTQTHPSPLLRLSLGLQLGGAVGNLLDRFRLDHVTDFIDVGSWPVFNLADASIVTGLLLLAWIFMRPGADNPPPETASPGENRHWCPICDGDMERLGDGWRCPDCGARERLDFSPAAPAPAKGGGLPSPGECLWCPRCDSPMVNTGDCNICPTCGAREVIDQEGVTPPAAVAPSTLTIPAEPAPPAPMVERPAIDGRVNNLTLLEYPSTADEPQGAEEPAEERRP